MTVQNRNGLAGYVPFLLAFLFTVALKCAVYPSLTTSPEMWEEGATNFYFHAAYSSLWRNVVTPDAGYIPWIQRFVALSASWLQVPIAGIPFYYQTAALCFIGVCCAFFALPLFRFWIASDWQRVLLCLALASYEDYQLHTFLNFPYFGSIVVFLVLLSVPEISKYSKGSRYGLAALVCAIFLSKGVFLAFVPLVLCLLYSAWRKRDESQLRFLALPSLALLLQGLVAAAYALYPILIKKPEYEVPSGHIPSVVLWTIVSVFARVVLESSIGQAFYSASWPGRFFGLAGSLCWIGAMVRLVRDPREKRLRQVLAVGFGVAACAAVLVVGKTSSIYGVPLWGFSKWGIPGRWGMVTYVCLFLSGALCIARLGGGKPGVAMAALVCWVMASPTFKLKNFSPREPGWPSTGFSDWKSFSAVLSRPEYCVPINPFPIQFARGCGPLEADVAAWTSPWRFASAGDMAFPVPAGVTVGRTQSVGFVFASTEDLTLDALDSSGAVLETLTAKPRTPERVTYLHFSKPVPGISKLRFRSSPTLAVLPDGRTPLGLWILSGPSVFP